MEGSNWKIRKLVFQLPYFFVFKVYSPSLNPKSIFEWLTIQHFQRLRTFGQ